ncbi:MAG: NirD/YgiW/YdeI family stress tolerance protein [Pseudomonadota bacterium]
MISRRTILVSLVPALAAGSASAQFTGPSVQGGQATVAVAQDARVGSYHTLEGNIVTHLRENYFMFRDATGEMRVEIPADRFGGQQVGPETTVRIMGEIDRTLTGRRYLWVKSLEVVG